MAHEINHALSDEEGITGFSRGSKGFNEIVNEYLTIRAMEKAEQKDFKNNY